MVVSPDCQCDQMEESQGCGQEHLCVCLRGFFQRRKNCLRCGHYPVSWVLDWTRLERSKLHAFQFLLPNLSRCEQATACFCCHSQSWERLCLHALPTKMAYTLSIYENKHLSLNCFFSDIQQPYGDLSPRQKTHRDIEKSYSIFSGLFVYDNSRVMKTEKKKIS